MIADFLHVESVRKVFSAEAGEVVALDDVDLRAGRGEFICLRGASGSGKSTLLNVLAGLESPDRGSVVVGGQEMAGSSEDIRAHVRLTKLGIVFQDDNVLFELSAIDNLLLPLEALGVDGPAAREQAESALARVGLGDLCDRLPAAMSGGQRQRVGVARALTGGRSAILADEPTGSLDSVTSRDLFALFRQLSDEGLLVVVATHDPIAEQFATRVVDMVDGRLTERA
ncbi:ABC transporter ATP-binding protein [Propionibacteriaceae bacterium G1746]|uniref:ABC transporter ATP-binding protein n=1 Tax=Aestuariimicrobium sp. G57 TaxID=3418485 RepID=UPI003C237455